MIVTILAGFVLIMGVLGFSMMLIHGILQLALYLLGEGTRWDLIAGSARLIFVTSLFMWVILG